MVNDPETGALCPFNFDQIACEVPEIKEFGFTAEELKPSCPATGSYDLEELGQMTDKELRHFSYSDVEGVKEYLKNRSQSGPKL